MKIELAKQGRQYAKEAMSYREKIAQLALGFIKDGSVVRRSRFITSIARSNLSEDSHTFVLASGHAGIASCTQTKTDIGVRYGGKAAWTWVCIRS